MTNILEIFSNPGSPRSALARVAGQTRASWANANVRGKGRRVCAEQRPRRAVAQVLGPVISHGSAAAGLKL